MCSDNQKLCEHCKIPFTFKSTKAKFCGTICKQAYLRATKKVAAPILQKECLHCNTTFFPKKKSAKFCCLRCQQMTMRSNKFVEEDGMVSCACCGMKAHELTKHITCIHKMTTGEYTETYNTPFRSEKYLQEQSERVKGDKNPGYQHGGKFSALSDKFVHASTTNKEEIADKISKSNKENGNTPTTLKYWLKQGYTEDDAKEKLSERQSTFSLDICVAKYGQLEGAKRWSERQEKWLNTLDTKPIEEIERINRAKMLDGRGYSKISQALFVAVYDATKDVFPRPHFATLNSDGAIETAKNHHHEWFHISHNKKKFFFDYFVRETKSIIEFDGDYWHGEKRGNQERDAERDAILLKEGFRLLHIKERDYRADPNKTIKQCVEFLNG